MRRIHFVVTLILFGFIFIPFLNSDWLSLNAAARQGEVIASGSSGTALSLESADLAGSGILSFEQRLKYQEEIERLYFERRVWPEVNSGEKPSFEETVTTEIIRSKVENYLRLTNALRFYWSVEISGENLQAEIDRLVLDTKKPVQLEEMVKQLGNDPLVVAECLARPLRVDRTIRELYAEDDRFHGELAERARYEVSRNNPFSDRSSWSGDAFIQNEYIRFYELLDESVLMDRAKNVVPAERWLEARERLLQELPMGQLGPLNEDMESFSVSYISDETGDRIVVTSVVWWKKPFDQWWSEVGHNFTTELVEPDYAYVLDNVSGGAKDTEVWEATAIDGNTPLERCFHTAVWTGAEMIVWGGRASVNYNSGGRYYPDTDSWLTTSLGANVPSERYGHTAIWTGSEMIVWGGQTPEMNTGGRYDPVSNTWTETNTAGVDCPLPRSDHTAVWSGSEMVVWGGDLGGGAVTNTGGKYDPDTDSWIVMGTTGNCPIGREWHAAAYSNTWGMVIWGGFRFTTLAMNSGAHYFPVSDTWITTGTTNVPTARYYNSAIINSSGNVTIWGGRNSTNNSLSGGAILDGWGGWINLNGSGDPSARYFHGAVLIGDEMLIWGGNGSSMDNLNTGGRYDFSDQTWTTITNTHPFTPTMRDGHTTLLIDGVMIVWGGRQREVAPANYEQTGGIYYVCTSAPIMLLNNTASDVDACSDSGVEITWPEDATAWGSETGFKCHYDVLRDGTPIASGLEYGTTSYTDTTGTNGTTYTYSVRYRNACDQSVITTGVSAEDFVGVAPTVTVDHTNTDVDGCTANSGIEITWPQDPGGDWGDNGIGDRKYRVWRKDNVSGTWQAQGSQLVYGTTTYIDSSTITGFLYMYYVRYINGCGDYDTTNQLDFISDASGVAPTVSQTASATDSNDCTYSGIQISWPQDADVWGDSGTGTRYYRVRRSTDGVTYSPLGVNINYGTTTYLDGSAASDQLYYYHVRYKNGCDLNADSNADTATDQAATAPSSIPAFVASDLDGCADTGLEITWPQDPGDWGDRDINPSSRYYRVWRGPDCVIGNMSGIGSTIPYGTTSYIDNNGTNNTDYCYRVRYANACDQKTYSDGQTGLSDSVAYAPSIVTNSNSTDADKCLDAGIDISWTQDPADWGDFNNGTRTYDVLRDSTPIATGLVYGTTSYNDDTGVNGTAYSYQVRYNNGCGLSSITTGSNSNDRPFIPGPLDNNSASDDDACINSGITITWTADPTNAWGDGAVGSRTYDVLRDGAPVVTGLVDGTTSYTDTTAAAGVTYTYTVRYANGCGLYGDTSPGEDAADDLDSTPCNAVDDSLTLAKTVTDASLVWTDVVCSDRDVYRVYGATSLDGTTLQNFPTGWDILGIPASAAHLDSLASAYQAYKIVTVDLCGNSSP